MLWKKQSYSGWGNALSATAHMARPERHGNLAELVAASDQILAVGARRSYGDAALAAGDNALSTARLDRFLAFDDVSGILEVESGVALGEILRIFAPRGWLPPVLPGTGMTTVGGAIANDVHGKNHHQLGSFGQHITQISLVTADGRTHRITPSRDKQLFKATLGGVGQTGLITSAKIKLIDCPSQMMDVREERVDDLEDFLGQFESSHAPYQVGWIDALAKGKALGRGIFEAAEFSQSAQALKPAGKTKSLPITLPGVTLSSPIVRMFNHLYRTRIPADGRTRTRALGDFFFPLDKISNWNKAYGKKGFHQFQCVVPLDNASSVLTSLLKTVAQSGTASPLAVLKRLGEGRAGCMSFPMEGYTLAIDIPNRKKSVELLKRLEKITLDAHGRIYLAKDGAASAQSVHLMYPEMDTFQAAVQKVDPGGKFASAMSERLNLRGAL
jgi:decaprenylphospho-beta-D-ribofuranose 2-oxidase